MVGIHTKDDEFPLWYTLIVAARYLGVPPWELEDQPMVWLNRALTAQSLEAEADAIREKRGK